MRVDGSSAAQGVHCEDGANILRGATPAFCRGTEAGLGAWAYLFAKLARKIIAVRKRPTMAFMVLRRESVASAEMCEAKRALWLLVWLGAGGVSEARVLLSAVGSHVGYTGKNAAPSTFGKSVSTAPSKLSVKQQRHGQGGISHMAARELVGADTFDGTVNINMRAFKVKRTKKSDGTTRLSLTKGVRRSVRPAHPPCCALAAFTRKGPRVCFGGPGAWRRRRGIHTVGGWSG
jgi:hypothetical protein